MWFACMEKGELEVAFIIVRVEQGKVRGQSKCDREMGGNQSSFAKESKNRWEVVSGNQSDNQENVTDNQSDNQYGHWQQRSYHWQPIWQTNVVTDNQS